MIVVRLPAMSNKDEQRSTLLWEQVHKGDKSGTTGSCYKVKCKHCDHAFVVNTSKLMSHLLGKTGVKCTAAPPGVAKQVKALTAVKEAAVSNKKREREEEELQQQQELQMRGFCMQHAACSAVIQ
jgi:molybdenum cofactor biosynthesis enzyme MoaA